MANVTGTSKGEKLTGSAGDDEIYGLEGADKLLGLDGNDRLYGGDGKDDMEGGAGRDVLIGGLSDDKMDGGEGTDFADFSALSSNYTITTKNGTTTVVDTRAGAAAEGADTMNNVERLRFSDTIVFLVPNLVRNA